MDKKRYTLFLFLSLALYLNPLSAIGSGGSDGGSGGTESADTLNVAKVNSTNTVLFKRVLEQNLGERMNPVGGKIASWDTFDINIYNVDMSNFRDTVTYVMHDPDRGVIFTMPTQGQGRVTSGFGMRRLHGRRFHYGIDIDLETGDPVSAAMSGTVRIARYSGGYGYFVVISHKDGLESLYGHMSELKVKEGEQVESGQVIGLGGSTGHSTGSHLHFEFRIFGEQINPSKVFSFQEPTIEKREIKVDQSWFSHVVGSSKSRFHMVEEGETLESIAEIYSTDVSVLVDLNRLESGEIALSPGKSIRYQ